MRVCEEAAAAAAGLRDAFDSTPYRPTGLSTSSRALVRLVDELTWLSTIVSDSAPSPGGRPVCDPAARAVRLAAAVVLERAADLLDAPHGPPEALRTAMSGLRAEMAGMERGATALLPVRLPRPGTEPDGHAFIEALDLSFRAQELVGAALQTEPGYGGAPPPAVLPEAMPRA